MTQSLKVSSKSVPHSVAGALAGILREAISCEVQVIGAGALNQAIKAIAIARTYLTEDKIGIVCVPEFTEVDIDGQSRTAILLTVMRSDLPGVALSTPDEYESGFVTDAEREVPGGLFKEKAQRTT